MKKNDKQNSEPTPDNKEVRCGLVMPIAAIDGMPELHWIEVKEIICEALHGTGFTIELVSHATDIGIIHKRIVQNLFSNEIIICDVSARNPNVMFELGMRLAFDKPAIIIKDDKTPYSFDTSSIEHLQYPRDLHYQSVQTFKSNLREKVLATYEASKKPGHTTFLKHFGEFVVAKIDEKQVNADQYILQAVADLTTEVRELSKRQTSSPMPMRSSSRMNGAIPLFSSEEISFLKEQTGSMSKAGRESLLSDNSLGFIALVGQYYSKFSDRFGGESSGAMQIAKARVREFLALNKYYPHDPTE